MLTQIQLQIVAYNWHDSFTVDVVLTRGYYFYVNGIFIDAGNIQMVTNMYLMLNNI